MSPDEHKALDRRVVEEVLNSGDVARLDELFAPGPALEHLRRDLPPLRAAFPDARWTVDAQLAEGDRSAMLWTFAGTQTGPFQGVPPSGRRARFTGMTMSRHAGGKIAEQWIIFNGVDLMQQIGAIPAPEPAHHPAEAATR